MEIEKVPLDEIQRQTYLETMGIQSYFPRFVLPGAKESVQCAWPEAVELPQIEEVVSKLSPEPPLEAPSKFKVEFSKPPVDPKLVAVENVEPSNESLPEEVEEVRFQLAFIRVNDEISILNQIPYVGSSQLSQAHRTLLLNILNALNLNTTDVQFDNLPFRWPIIEGEHIDKGKKAASATLHSYLEQKQADGRFKCLLVMGEMASNFIVPEQAAWQVVLIRSLDEMLTMPQVKRDVWQQLSALIGKNAA